MCRYPWGREIDENEKATGSGGASGLAHHVVRLPYGTCAHKRGGRAGRGIKTLGRNTNPWVCNCRHSHATDLPWPSSVPRRVSDFL